MVTISPQYVSPPARPGGSCISPRPSHRCSVSVISPNVQEKKQRSSHAKEPASCELPGLPQKWLPYLLESKRLTLLIRDINGVGSTLVAPKIGQGKGGRCYRRFFSS